MQEERGGGGSGAHQPLPGSSAVSLAGNRSPTHIIKGDEINLGENRAEKGQVPTRAGLGGAEMLSCVHSAMGDVCLPWQPRLVPLKNQREAAAGDELGGSATKQFIE